MNTDKKIELLQQKDFGALFDSTIAFIKQNFKEIIKPIIIYALPFYIISSIISSWYASQMGALDFTNLEANFDVLLEHFSSPTSSGAQILTTIFTLIGYLILTSLVFNYVKMYKNSEGETKPQITKNALWNKSQSDIGWIFGFNILTGLLAILMVLVIGGLIGLIVTTIGPTALFLLIPILIVLFVYLIVPINLLVPVKLEEPNLSFSEALKKCFRLTKNNWWLAFGFILVFTMLVFFIIGTIALPIGLIQGGLMLIELGTVAKIVGVVLAVVLAIVQVIMSSFSIIAISVLFYSLYEKLTGKNLSEQIQSIGTNNTDQNSIQGI